MHQVPILLQSTYRNSIKKSIDQQFTLIPSKIYVSMYLSMYPSMYLSMYLSIYLCIYDFVQCFCIYGPPGLFVQEHSIRIDTNLFDDIDRLSLVTLCKY